MCFVHELKHFWRYKPISSLPIFKFNFILVKNTAAHILGQRGVGGGGAAAEL